MKIMLILAALLATACGASIDLEKRALDKGKDCAAKYTLLGTIKDTTHTMCKYDEKVEGDACDEIREIVNKHNQLRSDPKTSVTARAMCKVYWDPNIAVIAQHFANSCPSGHDKLKEVPGYGISVGQNLAWGHSSWMVAIQAWFDEVDNFAYGNGSTNGKAVGHYTQVVKDTTCRIGCGFANCDGTRTYVCNYQTGQYNYKTPFKTGKPCDDCPKSCSNNLCDTKGRMCYNGGKIDYSDNTCKCASPYSGDSCEILDCPGKDKYGCGRAQPYGYPEDFCKKYTNVPKECPVMCKTCKDDRNPGPYYVETPATKLLAATGADDVKYPAGSFKQPPPPGENEADDKCAGKKDRDFCTTWVKDEWCEWGDNMHLTYSGEKGTPLSFCPYKCKVCTR